MILRINEIIKELTDPKFNISDTLLKVQVLAYQLNNKNLKKWVNNESNGYDKTDIIPPYREVVTPVFGNLEQYRGYGMLTRSSVPLETRSLKEEYDIDLTKTELRESLSTYEHFLNNDDEPLINVSYSFYGILSKSFANDWMVSSAWKVLSRHTIKGVIHSVKSKLLSFVLDVADEMGEGDKIDITAKKEVIDNLFDKNFGYINTMNIISGSNNTQTNITGDSNKTNVALGDNISQEITEDDINKIKSLIYDLKKELKDTLVDQQDLDDIHIQISSIESQLKRDKPKPAILKSAIEIIKGLAIGAGANILSEALIMRFDSILL